MVGEVQGDHLGVQEDVRHGVARGAVRRGDLQEDGVHRGGRQDGVHRGGRQDGVLLGELQDGVLLGELQDGVLLGELQDGVLLGELQGVDLPSIPLEDAHHGGRRDEGLW